MTYIAALNHAQKVNGEPYENYRFVQEISNEEAPRNKLAMAIRFSLREIEGNYPLYVQRSIEEQEECDSIQKEAERHYVERVILMAVMWTAGSFGQSMLMYSNNYMSNSIFLHFYAESAAGIIAMAGIFPIFLYCKTFIAF